MSLATDKIYSSSCRRISECRLKCAAHRNYWDAPMLYYWYMPEPIVSTTIQYMQALCRWSPGGAVECELHHARWHECVSRGRRRNCKCDGLNDSLQPHWQRCWSLLWWQHCAAGYVAYLLHYTRWGAGAGVGDGGLNVPIYIGMGGWTSLYIFVWGVERPHIYIGSIHAPEFLAAMIC